VDPLTIAVDALTVEPIAAHGPVAIGTSAPVRRHQQRHDEPEEALGGEEREAGQAGAVQARHR